MQKNSGTLTGRFAAISAVALALVAAIAAPASAQNLPLQKPWKTIAEYKKDYVRPTKVPYLAENPYTPEKERLGQMLFFDPRLSGSNAVACANCHLPGMAWTDGVAKSVGEKGAIHVRNAPTLFNLAWTEQTAWDGRTEYLEGHVKGPIGNPRVMGQPADQLIAELGAIGGYRDAFKAAFPKDGITMDNVMRAIAVFERGLVSGEAPFDHWIKGNEKAISESAKRGFMLFNTKADCAACHSGWSFTDQSFYDIGLSDADEGRIKIIKLASMNHAFKTPTLREIGRTAPYMHDGSIANLTKVVEHYNRGGDVKRESVSEHVRPLNLTKAEIGDIVDFLLSLDAPDKPYPVPSLPMVDHKAP
ncbi:MAG: c-type cytochrome [Alphaproteobacteria bacterium]|nr:c-type cytochrome [Alphaproteobacteria bacterium]